MNELMPMIVYAVNLLAPLTPFLTKAGEKVAEKIGEAGFEKAKSLYSAIRDKFASDEDEYALQTLRKLEEQPENEGRKAALIGVLAGKADDDAGFAQQLERIVQEIKQDSNTAQFMTNVYGDARVSNIYNIGQVGQFTPEKNPPEE